MIYALTATLVEKVRVTAVRLDGAVGIVDASLTSVETNPEPVTYNQYALDYFAQPYSKD